MKEKGRLLVIDLFLMSFVPAVHAAGLSELELLGKVIYNNKNLSFNRNQSCQTCHHPQAAFADPANLIEPTVFPVSEGSNPEFLVSISRHFIPSRPWGRIIWLLLGGSDGGSISGAANCSGAYGRSP